MNRKTIAFVTYDDCTALDLIGPQQVLAGMARLHPEYRVVPVAADPRPRATDAGIDVVPAHTFDEIDAPAVIVVPGGTTGTLKATVDESVIGYLARTAETAELTMSVCTGSLLLGSAGLGNADSTLRHLRQNCRSAKQRAVLDLFLLSGFTIKEVISCYSVHGWWSSSNYGDIIRIGERRHSAFGNRMKSSFNEGFHIWKNASIYAMLQIGWVKSVDTDNNRRATRKRILAGMENKF